MLSTRNLKKAIGGGLQASGSLAPRELLIAQYIEQRLRQDPDKEGPYKVMLRALDFKLNLMESHYSEGGEGVCVLRFAFLIYHLDPSVREGQVCRQG